MAEIFDSEDNTQDTLDVGGEQANIVRSKSKADNLNYFLMNSQPGNSSTAIPVDIQMSPESHSFFQEAPPNVMPEKSKERPGFFESFGGRFWQQNEFMQLAENADRSEKDNSPLDDFVPPNWDPTADKSAFIGVDPRNMGYILAATGPKDQRRRYNYVLDTQEYNERLDNGSFLAQMAGGFGGFATSPSAWLPLAKAAKYAKVSQAFLQTLPKIAAGIGISSAAHEAVMETTKVGGNLADWAMDTFADTVLGTVFMGAGVAGSHLLQAGKIFNAKGVIKMMDEGIEPRPVLNEKGELKGWKATPIDGNASAAKVDMAQAYLDGSMAKNSLYSIPYYGPKIGYAAGEAGNYLAGKISPIVRMMNSPFTTMRGLISNVADHGIETAGVAAGRAVEDSFEHMMGVIRGTNVKLHVDYNGLYLQRNGISYNPDKFGSRTAANVEGKGKELFQDGWVSKEAFGREVQNVLINEEPSQHAAVNEAADMLRNAMDEIYGEYRKLHGFSEKILPPKTAKGYLSRVYNTAFMETKEERWMQVITEELRKDDAQISQLMEPINRAKADYESAKAAHDALIRKKNVKDEEVKASSDNLEGIKLRQKALENELQNNLRENPDLHRHVEDINAVSADEARQIKGHTQKLNDIKREIEAQKAKIDEIKTVTSRKDRATKKAKTAKTAKKQVALKDMSENDLEIEQRKLRELQEKHDTEELALQEQMHNGQIDPALFNRIPDSQQYKFKDPANRLRLRDVYESDFHRQTAAKAYYDTILNQTSEDNIANILGRMTGNPSENPLGKRTLMIRDQALYDNNFLHPDPSINVMNYRNMLGRRNAIKTVLNRLTVNGDFESLINRLSGEHAQMKADLSKPMDAVQAKIAKLKEQAKADEHAEAIKNLEGQLDKLKAKYDKQVKRLGRKYKNAKKDMELTFNKMMGRTKYSQTSREFSTLLNSWAAATKLGFVPLTMSTDLMATVFKFGFWPSVRDGLIPMLKTLGGMLNTAEGKDIRENAAHAHLAYQHVNMSYSDKNWTGTSQTYEPVQGKLLKGVETLAHYSNNFAGTNYVDNFLQRWAATVIQSKVMKAMLDFQAGKLADKDLKDLLRYGIDPKEWAERFVNEWKARGSDGNGIGGYQSRYWEWKDTEAATRMSGTIMRAVRDTIIRRGTFDAPFAMDNPIVNSVFLFKGYVMASLNRYMVPLMQRPDAQKLIGTMLMMAAGATQNPLRRLVAGQDPIQEDDHMFRNAIRDGGVFSVLGDAYEEANFLTNGYLQESVGNERYRGRTEMGVFNGPIGGMANDMSRVIGMLARNEINQTDLKRIAVNLPFVYSWQMRGLTNKMITSLNIPETPAQARRQKLNS